MKTRQPIWRPRGPVAAFLVLFSLEVAKHVVILLSGPPALFQDARHYWQLGGVVAGGDWLLQSVEIAYRTPGYPAFVGLCRASFGHWALLVALGLQHVLVIGTSLLTSRICYRASGSTTCAVIAYAVCVLSPTRGWYANCLLTETLFAALLTAYLAVVLACIERPSICRASAMGLVLAMCLLVRPIALLVWLPLLFVGIAAGRRHGRGRVCATWALSLTATAVLLAPWCARNQRMFGRPFLTQFVGRNLWIVCFQPGEGANLPVPEEIGDGRWERLLADRPPANLRHTWSVSHGLTESGLSDADADELMAAVCYRAIAGHPWKFGVLALKRFVNFWRCVVQEFPFYNPPDKSRGTYDGQKTWKSDALAGFVRRAARFVPARSVTLNTCLAALAATGTLGLLWAPETRMAGFVVASVLVYFAAVTAALEIPNYRYRLILEPAMIVAATSGFDRWLRTFFPR